MQLRWDNVVIVALVCMLVLVLMGRLDSIFGVLSRMESVTDGRTIEDRVDGLIPFALVVLLIVSLANAVKQQQK